MKTFFISIIALALFKSEPASATIYLVASDPSTHSVGIAAISSGPVVSYNPHAMNGVKGIGFTGWSGSVANVSPAMDKKVFELMQQSASANQIAAFVDSQIHTKYSRYIFISAQGIVGYVFPPNGCAQPECAVQVSTTQQFFIMGGGLEHDVVAKAVQGYEAIHQNKTLPFECKLLAGVQTIINVGGEIKEFAEAGIAVDRPGISQQEWFTSTDLPEKKITSKLHEQIAKAGLNCPTLRQNGNLKLKPKRDLRSQDL